MRRQWCFIYLNEKKILFGVEERKVNSWALEPTSYLLYQKQFCLLNQLLGGMLQLLTGKYGQVFPISKVNKQFLLTLLLPIVLMLSFSQPGFKQNKTKRNPQGRHLLFPSLMPQPQYVDFRPGPFSSETAFLKVTRNLLIARLGGLFTALIFRPDSFAGHSLALTMVSSSVFPHQSP